MSSRGCNVLVTGANGFLGVAVVERLLARGKTRIRCLVRAGSNRRRLDALLARYPGADVEIVGGGLSSPEAAARLIEGAPLILHLAAALSGQAADMFLGTVVASKHLLEAITASAHRPKVLLVSSFGVYGVADAPKGQLLDETTPVEPHPERRDVYSHTKLRQEQLFFEYRARYGIALCVLRPGVIYGPGGGAFSSRVGLFLPGMFLFLGGKNVLPLSYVDNCAEAICIAAERARFDGDVYNVHDDELISCEDYLRRYQADVAPIRVVRSPYFATMLLSRAVQWYHRHSRGQLPPIFTPYKTRTTWKGNRFSNAKLHALGFSPIVSTEEGLRRTFEYLREKGEGRLTMFGVLRALREKNFDAFLGGYLADESRRLLDRRRRPAVEGARHLLVALCDHYEPLWNKVDDRHGAERVRTWREGYPRLAGRYRDADGRPPRHSFFFPGEEYRPQFLEPLAELARAGLGEVEIHLHHDGDTAETLEAQLRETIANFTRHGHLSRDPDGRARYAFIHGNWALANARGDGRWCGVDEELPLLFRTGCYADFTFPAAPDPSQPNIVNRIYWPTGDLSAKRCYEHGTRARVGEVMTDRLLLLQGPLALSRRPGRTFAIRIENSGLTANDPPTSARAKTWVSRDIHVEGRPEWVFVKLHTHGAPDLQAASLLGEGGHELHRVLTTEYNDGRRWHLHYVTAREMFNIAIAAMGGKSGNPNAYRDHVLPPPPAAH